ncbi:alpha/beta fold hydrolase [Acaryochloris sp. IP29b_bin.148]|uniref:alpha/beta hydrolase n=1 Tax=Acaryochloris sp. IP29b_bin.148 TaxID=2969218 RepID=UPI00261D5DAB|nr:alpha/beta fold hydrolase [Acaryochloris sp. IP29b_bin.148]
MRARSGLVVRSLVAKDIPMIFMAPKNRDPVPGVLIAHGFAGSKQLMLGYGYTFAQAGYASLLWDFSGHGANPAPLNMETLQPDLEVAYQALTKQPEVDPDRLAILGHSMGSSAVMTASIEQRDRFAATIAVSPTRAEVTADKPANLLLQAGSGEGQFVDSARKLLQTAGGENQNLAEGKGRSLIVVPKVEHITILFSDISHQSALKWINKTFNQFNPSSYVDRRMGWYGLHLIGGLMAIAAIVPTFAPPAARTSRTPWRRWGGLLAAPFAATAGVNLISPGVALENLGGLKVGGALGIWFLFGGLVWLGVQNQWPLNIRQKDQLPSPQALSIGILVFILLWLAFGAMAQVVWLQWWLIPARLKLWPILSLACLPWFLASGLAQQGVSTGKRILWWLGQNIVLIGGLILTISLLPQLGFIFLLLPIFPIIFGILSFVAAQVKDVWSYGVGGALFFGWTLVAAFPMVG